jgi:hypothetical protein
VRCRSVIFAKLRSPARAEPLAWAAILALLVQMMVGAPLASRMMIDAAWGAAFDPAAALCTSHEDAGNDGGSHQLPPQSHHDHQHCVLCQVGAAPLIVAAAVLLSPALVFGGGETAPLPRAPAPYRSCRTHDAEARAPPGR